MKWTHDEVLRQSPICDWFIVLTLYLSFYTGLHFQTRLKTSALQTIRTKILSEKQNKTGFWHVLNKSDIFLQQDIHHLIINNWLKLRLPFLSTLRGLVTTHCGTVKLAYLNMQNMRLRDTVKRLHLILLMLSHDVVCRLSKNMVY